MKKNELKLLVELMRNSKRTDRELAEVLGISAQTVSRTRSKLEKEGYIREYTAIPDFTKLGFEIFAITLIKLKQMDSETIEKARKVARMDVEKGYTETIFIERGMGMGFDGVIVSLHENYSSYLRLRERIGQYGFLEVSEVQSFIVNLADEIHYKPLTLHTIGGYLLKINEERE